MRKYEMWTEWKSILSQNPQENYFIIYLLLVFVLFCFQKIFEAAAGEG